MTRGIVHVLVQHGVLEPRKTGPAHAMDPEEARKLKLRQQVIARNIRKERIQRALDNGDPLPVFKQGRPRKYTPEQAIEVRKEQNKMCWQVYKKRLRDGLDKFSDMYAD
jgi:hypothetical protein